MTEDGFRDAVNDNTLPLPVETTEVTKDDFRDAVNDNTLPLPVETTEVTEDDFRDAVNDNPLPLPVETTVEKEDGYRDAVNDNPLPLPVETTEVTKDGFRDAVNDNPLPVPVETTVTVPDPTTGTDTEASTGTPRAGPGDQLLAPSETLIRTPTPLPITPAARPPAPGRQPVDLDPLVEAARPPGTFPRNIGHDEQVEYSLDPASGQVEARLVESHEPVVTGWDETPAAALERPVGSWAVVPSKDGVTATGTGTVVVPPEIRERLEQEADETGEPVSTVATLRYQHDLDSQATNLTVTAAARQRPEADVGAYTLAGVHTEADRPAELNDRYSQLLKALVKAEKTKKSTSNRRRAATRVKDLKSGPYKLPQIVVLSERPRSRRGGALVHGGKACSVCGKMIDPVRLACSPRARTCGLQGCQEEHHLRQERAAAKGRRRSRRRWSGGL